MTRFSKLFPANTPRRCTWTKVRGLLPMYPERNVGGLQCRYYRIRQEENLGQLRDTEGMANVAGHGEEVLEKIAREGKLSKVFRKKVAAGALG